MSLDGLFLVSAPGRIRSWNWGAETLFGRSRIDALRRGLSDLLDNPDAGKLVQDALTEAAATGSSIFQAEGRRIDGTTFPLLIVVKRLTEGSKRSPVLAVSCKDISDVRRLEQQLFERLWSLTETQEFLRGILDGSTDYAIIATDLEGRIKVWNEGAKLLYGLNPSEVLNRPVDAILFAEDTASKMRLREAFEAAQRNERFEDEFQSVARDGRTVPCRIGVGLMRAPNSRVDGYVIIVKDVTEERQASESLRRKTAFVTLLQNVAVAANQAATVEEAMQRALDEVCAATGWPVGHVYVRAGEWAAGLTPTKIWHLDDPERFQTFRTITEATTFPSGVGLPGRVLSSGKPVWVPDVTKDPNFPRARYAAEISVRAGFAFPVLVGQEIVAVLEFFADHAIEPDEQVLEVMSHIGTQLGRVVERSRAENERKVAFERVLEIQRLKELDQFKESFIRTISHELNTPITPIKLQLHLLKSGTGGPLTEAQQKSVSIVDRNMERLALLVQDLLDVSRIQSGQLKINKQPFDLAGTLNEAVELFQEAGRQAGIAIQARSPGPLGTEADQRRIVQVLVNFISNALKFTPAGGKIHIEGKRLNGEIIVRVTDTGFGLAPDQISRLFKPFSQVHDPNQTQVRGTGLGLYISRGIIEQHGGRIGCESEGPGKGSTFWFTLPARDRIPLQPARTSDAEATPGQNLTPNAVRAIARHE